MSQQQPPHGQDPRQPYGQGQPQYGQNQPPHGQGQHPHGQGQPQHGNAQQPYGYGNPNQGGGSYYGSGYDGGIYSSDPPKRGGRGGKITFFIGLGILVAGIITTVIGAVSVFGTFSNLSTSGGSGFSESAQVDAPANTSYMIMAQNPQGTPSCTVTDASGSNVALDTSSSGSVNDGTTQTVTVGGFNTTEAGTYTLECSGAQHFVYGEMDMGNMMVGSLTLVGGMFLAVAGFMVTIIGLVIWLKGRGKTTHFATGVSMRWP